MPLELGQAFGFARALVSANRQKVPHTHRDAISGEVGRADDEHGELRQLAAGDAAHHSEGRDDAVVRAIHQVADVVTRRRGRADRLDVQ